MHISVGQMVCIKTYMYRREYMLTMKVHYIVCNVCTCMYMYVYMYVMYVHVCVLLTTPRVDTHV